MNHDEPLRDPAAWSYSKLAGPSGIIGAIIVAMQS
jgi:hypothetical protein